ncbi:MAG: phage holin family protein [Gemmatimonadota bacterium]|nr:phage holin family protein [Gemmatimonadota bacterium]
MDDHRRDFRLDGGGPAGDGRAAGDEPPLGELFGQLTSDAGRLIRQEVALAKAELRETGATLARDGAKLGVAAALGLLGAMAATAFLIIALGDLLDNYWLSALLVTVLLLAVAAYLAKSAMNDVKRRGLTPEQTVETLREDVQWAKREGEAVKRGLTS